MASFLKAPQPSSSSPSSSPAHEFSFTISLHSNSSTTINDKSKPSPPSLALDLSPADDIFFHGHLLPLHLLSHFPSSPRFSTNSNDSFTLPITENEKFRKDTGSCNTSNREFHSTNNIIRGITKQEIKSSSTNTKSNSFSLFGLTKGNHKGENNKEKPQQNSNNKKKVIGYDMIQALKKYFFRKREKNRFQGEAYSRSGNLMRKNKPQVRGSRGEYSAPASMRTSPTNSGLLLAKGGASLSSSSSTNDSTMEELHAAIQAAIAHCKSSIAKEDKIN
ncbi:hypothetical protein RYX36_013769 [Vicia faba]